MFTEINNSNLVCRFFVYLKERFPVFIIVLYSVLFVAVTACFLRLEWLPSYVLAWSRFWLVVLTIFLFFLRLRLVDEIKDNEYDLVNHPERPVARGLLKVAELKKIIIFILVLEVFLQFFNSFQGIVFYIVAALYSVLMAKEFFIKNYLTSHLLVALFLHQIIFVVYVFYAISSLAGIFSLPVGPSLLSLVFLLFSQPLLFELGRKLDHRRDSQGLATDDTYVYRWGLNRSFALIMAVAAAQFVSLLILFKGERLVVLAPYFLFFCFIVFIFFHRRKEISTTARQWSLVLALLGPISFLIMVALKKIYG